MSESALDTQGALVFYGNDGAEAEEFIRSVTRIAKAAGRFRDNDWIIEEVAAALVGDALRWYIALDDDIQNDWKLLRRAILQKYPPPSRRTQPDMTITSQSASDALPIVPTPAETASPVAPPPPVAAPPPAASAPSIKEPRGVFRIKISPASGGTPCFLGIKGGIIVVASSSLEPLTAKYCEETMELRIISKGHETGERIAVRLSGSAAVLRIGTLELVDDQGRAKAESTALSWIAMISWNVGADNILKATSPCPFDFYLRPTEAQQQYRPVWACWPAFFTMGNLGQPMNLELEKV